MAGEGTPLPAPSVVTPATTQAHATPVAAVAPLAPQNPTVAAIGGIPLPGQLYLSPSPAQRLATFTLVR